MRISHRKVNCVLQLDKMKTLICISIILAIFANSGLTKVIKEAKPTFWKNLKDYILDKSKDEIKPGKALPEFPDPFPIEYLPVNIDWSPYIIMNGHIGNMQLIGLSTINEEAVLDKKKGIFSLNYRGGRNFNLTGVMDLEMQVQDVLGQNGGGWYKEYYKGTFQIDFFGPTFYISGEIHERDGNFVVENTFHAPLNRDLKVNAEGDFNHDSSGIFFLHNFANFLLFHRELQDPQYNEVESYIKEIIETWIADGRLFPELKN